jgi:hypothetical protein
MLSVSVTFLVSDFDNFTTFVKKVKRKIGLTKTSFFNSPIKMVFSKTDLVTTNFEHYFKTFKTNKRTSVSNIC